MNRRLRTKRDLVNNISILSGYLFPKCESALVEENGSTKVYAIVRSYGFSHTEILNNSTIVNVSLHK